MVEFRSEDEIELTSRSTHSNAATLSIHVGHLVNFHSANLKI